ncbi:MAG: MFS transporter [Bdellovibrionota bacterium]
MLKNLNLRCLRNPAFRRIFAAWSISKLGSAFSIVALMARFEEVAGVEDWAFLFAVRALPYCLLGYASARFKVAVVDRWDPRSTMIFADFARAAVFMGLVFSHDLESLFILVFLSSVFGGFHDAAANRLQVRVLSDEDLLSANSLGEATTGVLTILGIGLSGLVVGTLGATGSFAIDAVSFAFSGYILMTLLGRSIPAEKIEPVAASSTERVGSFGYLLRTKDVRLPLFMWTLNITLVSLQGPMFFNLVVEKGWGGAMEVGWATAAIALGGLAASLYLLIFSKTPISSARRLAILLAIDTCAVGAITVTNSFPFVLSIGWVLGVSEVLLLTYSITEIQRRIPAQNLARVIAVVSGIHQPLGVLAILLAGFLVKTWSAQTGFTVAVTIEGLTAVAVLVGSFVIFDRNQNSKSSQDEALEKIKSAS